MPEIASILEKALDAKKRVTERRENIRESKAELSALEAGSRKFASIDTVDDQAVLAEALRRVKVEIAPRRIEKSDQLLGEDLRGLARIVEELKRVIRDSVSVEQKKLVAEIVAVLSPYSIPVEYRNFNEVRTIDTAEAAAWTMQIVSDIGAAATWQTQPADETIRPRDERDAASRDSFDRSVLEHADEVIGIAQRYLANENSFIPGIYKNKKSEKVS